MLLSGGIHSFPFKLGLPLGLPSTFLGKHGWVQYFCKAALREETGLTHKNQQVFIIMNPIDLNLEPPILAVSPRSKDRRKVAFTATFLCETPNASFLGKKGLEVERTKNDWTWNRTNLHSSKFKRPELGFITQNSNTPQKPEFQIQIHQN